jgi:hypothetical protein
MNEKRSISNLLANMLKVGAPPPRRPSPSQMTNVAGQDMPDFADVDPAQVQMLTVQHPDGRMSQYPPAELWDDWVEYSGKEWPRKVAHRYMLIPTVCFNCESACGLLAYVDKTSLEIKKFEGNPKHPGSRGRNCAKGPPPTTRFTTRSASSTRSSEWANGARANGSGSVGKKR